MSYLGRYPCEPMMHCCLVPCRPVCRRLRHVPYCPISLPCPSAALRRLPALVPWCISASLLTMHIPLALSFNWFASQAVGGGAGPRAA